MYAVTKKVYYCSYCRKYKLTPQAIKVHELHCTLNPERACRVCATGGRVAKAVCPMCAFSRYRLAGWPPGTQDFNLREEMEAYYAGDGTITAEYVERATARRRVAEAEFLEVHHGNTR